MCVSGGKKCLFFGNFGVLFFLETPVLRFALLPYSRILVPVVIHMIKDKPTIKPNLLSTIFKQFFATFTHVQLTRYVKTPDFEFIAAVKERICSDPAFSENICHFDLDT